MQNSNIEVPKTPNAAPIAAPNRVLRETVAAISNAASISSQCPAPGQNEIMKPADAAIYLRLSRSTLAKLRLYGTGPRYTKVGRAVRYRRADLDAWINARYAGSTIDADHRLPLRLADPLPEREAA
jgi:predicted DNA-binding transcriptional regulator AlpA